MKKLLINSLFLLGTTLVSGQALYKAETGVPEKTGFYKLVLAPGIVAKSLPGLPDIRLIENGSKAVPYILKTEAPTVAKTALIEFPILSIKRGSDSLVHVNIYNDKQYTVNQLALTINNTDAQRTISISGSNDSTQWYIVKENISLERSYENEGSFTQNILLPVTKYNYYSIILNGKNLLPVNIIKAGIYKDELTNGNYEAIDTPVVNTYTKAVITYVNISFNDVYQLDQLKIQVSAPHYFRRNVNVYGGHDKLSPFIGSFQLNSREPLILPVNFKGKALQLQVENGDNPPLTITNITAYQLTRYMLAYVETNKHYTLIFGDSAATAPVYDLDYFSDSISLATPLLSIGNIEKTEITISKTKEESKLLLWLVTGIVLVILLLITFKMITEIKKKNSAGGA